MVETLAQQYLWTSKQKSTCREIAEWRLERALFAGWKTRLLLLGWRDSTTTRMNAEQYGIKLPDTVSLEVLSTTGSEPHLLSWVAGVTQQRVVQSIQAD